MGEHGRDNSAVQRSRLPLAAPQQGAGQLIGGLVGRAGGCWRDVAASALIEAVLQGPRRVRVKDDGVVAPDLEGAGDGTVVAELDGALVRVLALAKNLGCPNVSGRFQ
jgi:hypothetical protein